VVLALIGVTSAMAAPPKGARPLAVSVPSEPTQAPKGTTVRIPIRVVNPGTQAVTVTITPRQVLLLSNGQVSMGTDADPRWQGRVQFAPDTATIGPQQFINVIVSVDVPPTITSDLHFVGFLVSPAATAQGQVTVVNQIGSFVTLDVPGPRSALIQVTLRVPGFTLGRQATGHLEVANVGQSSVRFWGESNTTSWPGSSSTQQLFDKALVPTGTTQTLTVSAKPAWPVGFVTIHGQVIYPATTESATTEIQFSKRVLVIDPRLIAASAAVLVIAVLLWWLRRRHHRTLHRLETQPTPNP
jgi:hypothetical protein